MAKECKRCKQLESIILDTHWMARRYADGRKSYAPDMFNRAMDRALALELPLKPDTALGATYYATYDGNLSEIALRRECIDGH